MINMKDYLNEDNHLDQEPNSTDFDSILPDDQDQQVQEANRSIVGREREKALQS